MAISQTTQVTLNVLALLQDTLDLSTVRDDLAKGYTVEIGNGTGVGLANQIFHDQFTITTGATQTLDVATGGGLLSPIRQAIALTTMKVLIVRSAPTNTTIVSVTRPTNGVPFLTAAADACPVGPGGMFVWASPSAGVTVTAATGDLIDLVNAAGASAVVDVIIVGVQ